MSNEQELQDQASIQPAHYDSKHAQAAALDQDHCEFCMSYCIHTKINKSACSSEVLLIYYSNLLQGQ